jgi:hypothetical protein
LRDLVVAADDVVLLVGRPEDPQLALARVAEQIEQVEAALLGRLGAVLDVVGQVEQLAELGCAAAGHVEVDVLRDRQRVEVATALRGRAVERGVARRADV